MTAELVSQSTVVLKFQHATVNSEVLVSSSFLPNFLIDNLYKNIFFVFLIFWREKANGAESGNRISLVTVRGQPSGTKSGF